MRTGWYFNLVKYYAITVRHNESESISNHRRLDCLFKPLFRRRSKKTPKLRVTGLREGNTPVTGERASNAENVSIWWRHHAYIFFVTTVAGRPFWQTPGASIAISSALSGWCHRKSQLSSGPRILCKKRNNLTSNVSWTCAEIYLALLKIIRTTLYQTTNSTWTVCALILVFCHWIIKSKFLPAIAL